MKSTRWTDAARYDLSRLDDFYAASPGYSDFVGDTAVAAGRYLAENPSAGPTVQTKLAAEARKWPVGRTPYILLYRIADDTIEILRLVHDRSDWKDEG